MKKSKGDITVTVIPDVRKPIDIGYGRPVLVSRRDLSRMEPLKGSQTGADIDSIPNRAPNGAEQLIYNYLQLPRLYVILKDGSKSLIPRVVAAKWCGKVDDINMFPWKGNGWFEKWAGFYTFWRFCKRAVKILLKYNDVRPVTTTPFTNLPIVAGEKYSETTIDEAYGACIDYVKNRTPKKGNIYPTQDEMRRLNSRFSDTDDVDKMERKVIGWTREGWRILSKETINT